MKTIDERITEAIRDIAVHEECLGLTARAALAAALLAKKAALPHPWAPTEDAPGYMITGSGVIRDGAPLHQSYTSMGMIAPTREACKRIAKRMRVLNRLYALAECSGKLAADAYVLAVNSGQWFPETVETHTLPLPQFATYESARTAIAKLGDDLNVLLDGRQS